MENLTCQFCQRTFTRKTSLNKHISRICPEYRFQKLKDDCQNKTRAFEGEYEDKIKTLKDKYESKLGISESEIKALEEKYQSETKSLAERYQSEIKASEDACLSRIKSLEEKYQNEIESLKEKYEEACKMLSETERDRLEELIQKREALARLETTTKHAEKLENHILKENSKPRNNITINMAPYDLTEELATRICEGYTIEHFKQGPEATYNFLLQNYLKTEDGRLKLKCTDMSRQVFKGIREDGTEFTDVGAICVKNTGVKPLKKAVINSGDKLLQEEDIELDFLNKKTSSHFRVLEKSRLGKKLAGDLK